MQIHSRTLCNSDCLTCLERFDDGIFTLIYLDSPRYNKAKEGADFEQYPKLISQWVQQCWRLLSDKGTLYFHAPSISHIDYRLIISQAFGRLPSTVITLKSHIPSAVLKSGEFAFHSEILRYAKTRSSIYNAEYKKTLDHRFNQEDERGPYMLSSLTSLNEVPSLRYLVGQALPPAGRSWRFSKERMEQYIQEGRIAFSRAGQPRLKRYFDEIVGTELGSIWDDIQNSRLGPYGKAPQLCQRIIKQATNEGDWVLDLECGAGQMLIEAQQLGRNWIGCEANLEAIEIAKSALNVHLAGSRHTLITLDANDLSKFDVVWNGYRELLLSIDDIQEIRTKLLKINEIISSVKSHVIGQKKNEDEILEALLDALPGAIWLMFPDDLRTNASEKLQQRMDQFFKLQDDSQKFLVTAFLSLEILPEAVDYSVVSMSAWKAVENELNSRLLMPFRDWFISNMVKDKFKDDLAEENGWEAKEVARYVLNGKPPPLGTTCGILRKWSSSKKTIKISYSLGSLNDFLSQNKGFDSFVRNDDGLLETLSQENINKYRNGAAHTSVFDRNRAMESFNFVLDKALKKILKFESVDAMPSTSVPYHSEGSIFHGRS